MDFPSELTLKTQLVLGCIPGYEPFVLYHYDVETTSNFVGECVVD